MKAIALVPMLFVSAVLVAGCGGRSAAPGVASLGGTTTTSAADGITPSGKRSQASTGGSFSHCMRSHGITNFPDPKSGGGIQIGPGTGLDPDSPRFQAAERACEKLIPPGKRPTPEQQAKMQAQLLRFSACMRSHGVPNFPDPQFSDGGAKVTIGGGSGINPSSPQFKAAQTACKQYLPGFGQGPGPGSGGTVRVPAP